MTQLGELLEQLSAEGDRKIVHFSEWTTMLKLIEPLLKQAGLNFVRLDGQMPQKKQQQELVHRYANSSLIGRPSAIGFWRRSNGSKTSVLGSSPNA